MRSSVSLCLCGQLASRSASDWDSRRFGASVPPCLCVSVASRIVVGSDGTVSTKLVGMDCLFCKIVAGEIPAKRIYEDEKVIAFHDISPKAPTHVLVIPRKHIASPLEIEADDEPLIGAVVRRGRLLAEELGLESGFRLVFNCGEDAGYSVFHVHMHLLGGRRLGWPPG